MARFLSDICVALSELPTEQISHEAGVLEAENASGVHPLIAALFNLQYGNQGAGLQALPDPDPRQFTPGRVQTFANRWFVPANAFLQILGQLPPGLRLPLPQGAKPPHAALERPPVIGPSCTFDEAVEGVGMVIELSGAAHPALTDVCVEILMRRLLDDARFRHGFSYSVETETYRLGGGLSSTAFALDGRPGVWRDLTSTVCAAVLSLCQEGPTSAELANAIERREQSRMGPMVAPEETWDQALADLYGWPQAAAEALQTVSTADIRAALSEALASVIVCGPPDAAEAAPQQWADTSRRIALDELPPGRSFRPPALAQLFSGDARKATVVLSDDGVGQTLLGSGRFIRWPDVVGVLDDADEEMLVIFGRNGTALDVGTHYRLGAELINAVRDQVSDIMFFTPWHRPDGGDAD